MIDLRSDTVTKPCATMRKVMFEAEVGDDVTGDDPTINELERYTAELLGFEAGLFAPSGVQANLVALLSHCQRGDEYIVGQTAHTYLFEGGGAAVLGSIVPQPLDQEADGTLDLNKVKSLIKPNDYHFAQARLLCLENTTWGKVLPMPYLADARAFCDEHKLGLHLDGARIFNASVAMNVEPIEIAKHFDSVSCCLSKGLGAPVGSVLVGSAQFIKDARRWRKMLGGGMRQAGIIAAGGLYALKNNIARLADDHANARTLANKLSDIEGLNVDVDRLQTNMVFATVKPGQGPKLAAFLKERDIIVYPGDEFRLVMHLDISTDDLETVAQAFGEFDYSL
jgi:threonine aldolase